MNIDEKYILEEIEKCQQNERQFLANANAAAGARQQLMMVLARLREEQDMDADGKEGSS